MNNYKQKLKPMITLFKAHQQLVKFIKIDISDTNLDLNEFAVLEVVYHYNKITVNEIHNKLLVAASSLSYILNKLKQKNLIIKEQSKADKRVYYVSLTNNGNKLANNIFKKHYSNLEELFNVLTTTEKDTLSNLLKKIGKQTEKKLILHNEND